MPLGPGAKLGPYEILAPLGAGGMGEVYRARDTRLGRDVAIKLLPAEVAQDSERLARFRREAHLLASLNHPHIAAVHDLEELDGRLLLVLELVEGEDLAERLKRGAIPVDEALDIAQQIAEALEEAHEKGIVHRDFKPANIKVTPAGKAKVLDFGLAKAYAGDQASNSSDASHSPTLTRAGSESGVLLGTAAYMSPEQARGKPVDKRADIWAFGVVLFEMLAGKRLFHGETTSDTLAAVLKTDPDWGLLPEATPRLVRSLLRRCLQKEKERRLHDIADARIEIEEARAEPTAVTKAPPARRRAAHSLGLLALIAAALAATAGVWLLRTTPSPAPWFPKRLDLELPPGLQLLGESWEDRTIAISPDGQSVAFVGIPNPSADPRIYLRKLNAFDAVPLTGVPEGYDPFFSPDGEWLAFYSHQERKLKKVRLAGGDPVAICDADETRGGSWSEDGTIVFAQLLSEALLRVPASGGMPQPVANVGSLGGAQRWPQVLPGGKAAIFGIMGKSREEADQAIGVLSLATGKSHLLVRGAVHPRYSSSGHLLYAQGHSVVAAPFDIERLELTGPGVPVLDGVWSEPRVVDVAYFDVSRAGSLIYVLEPVGRSQRQLVTLDRQGRAQPLTKAVRAYASPAVSPDGRRLAVAVESLGTDLWVGDLERDAWAPLTSDGDSATPVWYPDGKRLAFYSRGADKPFNLYSIPADGGSPELLRKGGGITTASSFSPDGRALVFIERDPATGGDLWTLSLDGAREAKPFLATPSYEGAARFSPDGRWLAYASDESGQPEVYIRPFPGPGKKLAVSIGGGFAPRWPAKAGEIFYRTGNAVFAVPVRTGPELSVGQPRKLFEIPLAVTRDFEVYDVFPDGQRFVAVKDAEAAPRLRLAYIPDFFDELRAKLKPLPAK